MPAQTVPSPDLPAYDAVVVGARCAGAATALLLARRGLRVLVVDRARRGSDTLSTHALMRPAVVQLQRWGLLDAVREAGTPPVRRTVFHYGPDRVAVTLRAAAGTDALLAPRRTVLDSVLLDAAEQAGADVWTGVAVRDLVRDAGRVVGVVVDDGSGGPRVVRADVTVGADGVRSLVAARAGAPVEQQGAHAAALVYGYFDALPSDGYEWFYGERTTAGLIPTNDDQTLLFVARPAQRRGHPIRPGLAGVQDVLAQAWPEGRERLEGAQLASRLRQFRGIPGFRRTAAGPGWALVGDAGYFKDPMSTHGISQALRDAELLADALTCASGQTREQALRAYQRSRDALSAPMFDAVERIASFDWDLTEVRTLLRTVSSAISDEVDLLAGLDAAGQALSA